MGYETTIEGDEQYRKFGESSHSCRKWFCTHWFRYDDFCGIPVLFHGGLIS